MRFFLKFSYFGATFHGWQKQPGHVSVQETLENAIKTVLNRNVACHGCGRTDSGVHARVYYAHLDLHEGETKNFIYRVNKLVGDNIFIKDLFIVEDQANAQRDAISRTYRYNLHTVKDPFVFHESTWMPLGHLELENMQESARQLSQFSDFSPYCKVPKRHKHTICDIKFARWEQRSDHAYEFIITADHFLRGMIRLLVGNMVEVGKGNQSVDEFFGCLKNKIPPKFFNLAPPQGLHLADVTYPFQLKKYEV